VGEVVLLESTTSQLSYSFSQGRRITARRKSPCSRVLLTGVSVLDGREHMQVYHCTRQVVVANVVHATRYVRPPIPLFSRFTCSHSPSPEPQLEETGLAEGRVVHAVDADGERHRLEVRTKQPMHCACGLGRLWLCGRLHSLVATTQLPLNAMGSDLQRACTSREVHFIELSVVSCAGQSAIVGFSSATTD
jgi:hypothetical protein